MTFSRSTKDNFFKIVSLMYFTYSYCFRFDHSGRTVSYLIRGHHIGICVLCNIKKKNYMVRLGSPRPIVIVGVTIIFSSSIVKLEQF